MISLIIPTYNKAPRLELMLLSLTKLLIPKNISLEVIIINDFSTDNTQGVVKDFLLNYKKRTKFDLFLINSDQSRGRSGARNLGVSHSRGDLIIFTDDDVILEERFILDHFILHKDRENLLLHGSIFELPYLKFICEPKYNKNSKKINNKVLLEKLIDTQDIIGSKIKIKEQARKSKFEKDIIQFFNYSEIDNSFKWVCCIGANFSIAKDLFLEIGGFDEQMGIKWGCEDLEFGYRANKKGVLFKNSRENECVNYHMSHFRENVENDHKIAFSYFYRKHNDEKIKLLWDYFDKNFNDLLEWWEKCIP
ncbi:glycosyltransferase [Cytobacillus kochii]|uniref:glycosyltransferase family 2 protein n=1 Tax=Cytobacillus kochii TaxID=859143 RepID=UPI001CD347A8|nr:glycosyltransferase [Cytobacillus kochii]MCA1028626.1 glycosyltransferase [Cytobacillus kochii]